VTVKIAQRGEKAALADTVATNARGALLQYSLRRSGDFTARSQALADIQEALGLADAPLRLECFDVSHLGGTNPVASMVVFEDGLPRKDQYRKFSIAEARDDTDAIYQVLRRRLAYLHDDRAAPTDPAAPRTSFHYRPGLLVIDGGQPQVAAAARALRDEGINDIAVCGIAKRLEEVWLPDSDYPVILPRSSDSLFLLQRLRDEAHRFALRYQKVTRSRDIRSQLSSIPGLGPARTAELLKHFGSVTRLRAATVDALMTVDGIGSATAALVHRALHGDG
jgi:excinuclease ABC subunit C